MTRSSPTLKRLLWVARILVSGGLLGYIFYTIPLVEILHSIAGADPWYLGLALLFILVNQWFQALRMRQLTRLQNLSLTTRQILEVNLTSKFYAVLLPGNVGRGAIRWYGFTRVDRKPAQAFTSIAYNLVVTTLAFVVIGMVLWLLDGDPAKTRSSGVGLAVLLVGLSLAYVIVFNRRIASVVALRVHRSALPRKPRRTVVRLIGSLNRYAGASRRFYLGAVAMLVVVNLMSILLYVVLARSLGVEASFVTIGWVRSYALAVSMLPISILGLGVREATLVVLLAPYGVTGNTAVAYSFLLLSIHFVLIGMGGILEARNALFARPESRTEPGGDG